MRSARQGPSSGRPAVRRILPRRRRSRPDLAHVLGRLPPRHPQTAHQAVNHVRSEMVPDRRPVADFSVQYAVDLRLSKSLAGEQIDQVGKSDLSSGPFNNGDHLGAGGADSPQESRPDAAEVALHSFVPKIGRHARVIVGSSFSKSPGAARSSAIKTDEAGMRTSHAPAQCRALKQPVEKQRPRFSAKLHPSMNKRQVGPPGGC